MKHYYLDLDLIRLATEDGAVHLDKQFILIDTFDEMTEGVQAGSFFVNHPVKLSFTVVIFCISGWMKFQISLQNYVLNPNDILIVQEGTIGEYRGMSEDAKIVVIALGNEYFQMTNQFGANTPFKQWLYTSPICHLKPEDIQEAMTVYGLMKQKITEKDIKGENMSKRICKFISCVLVATFFMSFCAVSAFAAGNNYDLNGDGKVSVSDVTALQIRLSGDMSNWNDEYEKRADVNGDGYLNINDVTALQNILMNAASGGTSSGANAANSFLIKLPSNKIDSSYHGRAYKLTDKERAYIEKIVMGEFGTSYAGSVFIAQCIRDALVYGYCKDPMDLRKSSANGGMGYDGYKENVNDNVKNAVSYVFDNGGNAVQHRILVMCTSEYYYGYPNNWHSTQNFITQYENILFFDYWN